MQKTPFHWDSHGSSLTHESPSSFKVSPMASFTARSAETEAQDYQNKKKKIPLANWSEWMNYRKKKEEEAMGAHILIRMLNTCTYTYIYTYSYTRQRSHWSWYTDQNVRCIYIYIHIVANRRTLTNTHTLAKEAIGADILIRMLGAYTYTYSCK